MFELCRQQGHDDGDADVVAAEGWMDARVHGPAHG